MLSNQNLGKQGEFAAKNLYLKRGFRLIACNFTNIKGKQVGEIDLVFTRSGHIHFIEVKARSSERFGSAGEVVTPFKRKRLIKTIKYFLSRNPKFANHHIHIDIVFVIYSHIDNLIRKITIYSDAIDVDY